MRVVFSNLGPFLEVPSTISLPCTKSLISKLNPIKIIVGTRIVHEP